MDDPNERIPMRQRQKMIQPDMELSDSEDEGEGGRRNYQSNKSAGKASASGKTPEIEIPTSNVLSANSRATRSPHTATTAVSSETVPSPAEADAATDAAEKNGSAAMEVDTTK
ncbi:hypothetical protein RSAG8_02118, partial [Rhizoctonia solani AG-8 WAC10335]